MIREITFNEYKDLLNEIMLISPKEQYLHEIFMPVLRMSCPKGVVVVPVFDDRNTGRKSVSEKDVCHKNHMTNISAVHEDKCVVPDYVFMPAEYTYEKSCDKGMKDELKPIVMVETKLPKITKNGKYVPLSKELNKYKIELEAECAACNGNLIITDGIMWIFKSNEPKAVEGVCLINSITDSKGNMELKWRTVKNQDTPPTELIKTCKAFIESCTQMMN